MKTAALHRTAAGPNWGPSWGRLLRALLMLTLCAIGMMGAARSADATFKDEELDQMLAPIALYPDSLLSQILMASTYPSDVKEAAAWSKAHPDEKGDAAVKQIETKPWEPSVQSLVAFPQVLAMMDANPGDVQRLGDAFLADPAHLMDRVQFMRKKAQEAGNLKANEQQKVTTQTENNKQVIIIEPTQPQTVYVPVYQPTVVYGSWWYPTYPPYYWAPPPYYYPGGAFVAGVVWGAAIVGIHNSLWGGYNWGHHSVDINVNRYNNINVSNRHITNNNNSFKHNPERRKDVPYRDAKSREQYGNKAQAAGGKDRDAFKGKDGQRDADRARAADTLKDRGADPVAGREKLQGADRDKAHQAVNKVDRGGADSRPTQRDTSASNRAANRGSSGGSNSHSGALSGVHDSGASRANASRGQASRGSMSQHSGGGGRPAGGGGRAGGGGGRHR
ncbi:DUF3300 domain-containing protein [Paucibacter sp. TC2R-5]|uniref:DUF3300 domain-containing protein n=1 Tax=Paucibacter sp. TC2R-5 TaxID=2893555 RepID=UPI0021E4CFE0|nr:DUF3300 domain-containing protein [Paucibacter sp. TC2R-5]MCV2359336.1 DUF3300 domain-containing protein [Paucibacter sp. TC2R-5]